ncbi:MAG: class I SAM-dependent methyltransferase [Candidatus Ranarchaeia archaeon]
MDQKKDEWNKSFNKRDNFVFYPHEEIIRFIAKYIRKQIGYKEFSDRHTLDHNPIVLDLGCGIGRHVKLLDDFNLDAYGIDLSSSAIETAKEIFQKQNLSHLNSKLTVGSASDMPYPDNFFDFMLSHGVLDSMPFDLAKASVKEMSRCLKPDGIVYVDLISGDDSTHPDQFAGEEIVNTEHEQGTIQSFFNLTKINNLFERDFKTLESIKIKRKSNLRNFYLSRHHLVLQNNK